MPRRARRRSSPPSSGTGARRRAATDSSTSPTARATAAGGSSSSPKVSARKNSVSESVEPSMVGIERRVDRQHEVALDLVEVADRAVVHPQPAAVAERVAVRLLDRRAGRGADVREQERERMWSASSRRFRSFHAGSMLVEDAGRPPSPYQPMPNPSPLVVSRPAANAGSGRSASAAACRAGPRAGSGYPEYASHRHMTFSSPRLAPPEATSIVRISAEARAPSIVQTG